MSTIEQVIADVIDAIPDEKVRGVISAYRADLQALDRECGHRRHNQERDLLIGRAELRLGRVLGKVAS